MNTLTWSFAASSAQMLPRSTKYGRTDRLMVSSTSGSAACTSRRTSWQTARCQSGSWPMYSSTRESARMPIPPGGGVRGRQRGRSPGDRGGDHDGRGGVAVGEESIKGGFELVDGRGVELD